MAWFLIGNHKRTIMKRELKILTILMVMFFSVNTIKVYSQAEIIDKIGLAIKIGNSTDLAKQFNNSLDLEVPGNDGSYSKKQAELILKDFFAKYPPKSFTYKQQGASNDGSKYTIANYVSTNNKSFRIYYLIKKAEGNYLIHLLQFEEE